MKQLVGVNVGGYTFNAAAKTVTLTGLSTLNLEQILLITNVTRDVIIYQFNDPTRGGTISGNVITLTFNTTTYADSDRLQIFIDYPIQTQPITGTVSVSNTVSVSGTVSVSNFPATQPVSGTVTANQGTANTAANGWPVKITDGTNVLGTVTQPVRVDPTGTTTQPISGTVTADTELPAAATLVDATANPTVPGVGAFNEVFNGTTWDRSRGGLTADGNAVTGITATAPMVRNNAGTYDRLRGNISGLCTSNGNFSFTDNISTGSVNLPCDVAFSTIIGNLDFQYLYNGSTWDRQKANIDTAALITASGATTTQTGSDQINYNAKGVKVILDMTTVGTGSVTLEIDGKDIASGKYYPILTGAAVVTNSTNVYTVYPGITATANVSASDILPRTWRVKVTANNANATTYTVGASVIL